MQDKILIVDDEQEIADLVSLYLTNEGFQVFKFYNAADAWSCIQTENLDLAILDVMLPDMNGFELCQKIREKYQYPVINYRRGEELAFPVREESNPIRHYFADNCFVIPKVFQKIPACVNDAFLPEL